MHKILSFIFCFLAISLSAQAPIETIFEEWLKYHFSDGDIGCSPKKFDRTINLVCKGKSIKAKEYLMKFFPSDELFINETIQLLESAIDSLPKPT